MVKVLKVLFVGSLNSIINQTDEYLKKLKYELRIGWVNSEAAMRRELVEKEWDIIISNHSTVGFSSLDALQTMNEYKLNLPFIVVADKRFDASARKLMSYGCHDYIEASDIQRLEFVIRRELKETKIRLENILVKQKLIEEIENKAVTLSSIGDGVMSADLEGRINLFNRAAEKLTGYTDTEANGKYLDDVFVLIDKDGKKAESPFNMALQSDTSIGLKDFTMLVCKDGFKKYISANSTPIKSNNITLGVVIVFRDVTRIKQLQDSLSKSVNFYTTLFENFPTFIWMAGTDGELCYVNKRFLEFSGKLSVKDVLHDFWDMAHPEDKVNYQKAYHEKASNRIPFELYGRFRRNDGVYRWILVKGNPYYNENGAFAGYVGICYDVNDKKEAEDALELSEERFDTFMSNFPGSVFIKDENGRHSYANPSFEKLLGLNSNEWIGKDDLELWDRETAMQLRMNDAKVLESGELLTIEETSHIGHGTQEWLSAKFMFSDTKGKRYLAGISIDITEQKKIQRMLKESQEKYQSLFMHMTNPFIYCKIIFDEHNIPVDYDFIEVNDAYAFGLGMKRVELIGKTYIEIFGQTELTNIKINTFARVALGGGSINLPEVYFREQNKWYSITIYSPKQYYFAAIFSDISEQKKIEEELIRAKKEAEAANRAKSDFLTNMSHEIRTPLNGIIGMTNLTLLTEHDAEKKENLNIVKSSANSLLNVINDILDFSKIEAGKMSLEKIEFKIRDLIEEIVKPHSILASKKGLNIYFNILDDVPVEILGDSGKLKQILNNLIGNAVKFTEKGKIEVFIKCVKFIAKTVELEFIIEDTGIGIITDKMELLFKSFSQVDGSYTRRYGGTGLGLAISKQLVEMMGGNIWAESKIGIGSKFSFTVKFNIVDISKPIHKQVQNSQTSKEDLRVLLVEDDSINQLVISRMLKNLGYSPTIVSNGKEAVDLYKKSVFDLILMDVQMPEMDGIEATKIIRKFEEDLYCHVPIIALTAHALKGDREKFMSIGMDEYLAKPFEMNELRSQIDKIIGGQGKNYITRHFEALNIDNSVACQCARKQEEKDEIDVELIKKEIINNMHQLEELFNKDVLISIRDLGIVEQLAHFIKISATNLGKKKIRNTAFKLELAARACDYTELARLYVLLKANLVEAIINNQ